MNKRVIQLSFYSVYCVLALVGLLADFRIFRGEISTLPFVYYTSLSNMICSAFMAVSLLRCTKNKGAADFAPGWKLVFVVMILLTSIVYNVLLNPYTSILDYFANVKNCLYHLILPVAFLADWLLFYNHGKITWKFPFYALGIPFLYVIYILVRALIVTSNNITVPVLYPYFFLNIERLGFGGFLFWMMVLMAGLLALGFALMGLDRLLYKKMVVQTTSK